MANFLSKLEPSEEKKQPERKLWEAVLNQIFKDAFEKGFSRNDIPQRKSALDYLKNMHEDYYMVCENAGFDPNYVHRKVKRKINLEYLKDIGVVWNTSSRKKTRRK